MDFIGKGVFKVWRAARAAAVLGVVAVAVLLLFPARSLAQRGGGAGGGGADAVKIDLVSFGFMGAPRPGEWMGVLVQVTDTAPQPREIIVEWPLLDPDGDTALYRRRITTNPGVRQNVWLYGRLPFRFQGGEAEIRAYAVSDERGTQGAMAGRLPLNIPIGQMVPTQVAELGVVGKAVSGLELLAVTTESERALPGGHESTQILDGVRIIDLPDRWMGLASISTLVWTTITGEGDPANLSEAQAQAVREWVERGGHLIVILPAVGQTWLTAGTGAGGGNRLSAIMPRVQVEREENADLNDYRELLRDAEQNRKRAALPKSTTVHLFTPSKGAQRGEAVTVLAGPDGRSVVSRRSVGIGAVTVIGINLASQGVLAAGGVQADVFWNRVLGRRGELMTPSAYTLLNNTNKIARLRAEVNIEDGLVASIAKTGEAARGVLLAFLVFVAYWLLAGPVAFRVLKMRGATRHAWVAFVLLAGVFTAIAWGGAAAMKPRKIEATHLTFLDEVYGQPVQHARMWASVLLPTFGRMTIGVKPDEGAAGNATAAHNVIAAWEPASAVGTGVDRFPDATGYVVESRQPEQFAAPTRSTVKTVEADWLGAPRWKTPMPTSEGGVRIVPNPGEGKKFLVQGSLVHQLETPLRNVRIIAVASQFGLRSNDKRGVLADASAVVIRQEWGANQPLDLDALFNVSGVASLQSMMDSLTPSENSGGRQYTRNGRLEIDSPNALSETQLVALSLFSLLAPPEPSTPNDRPVQVRRHATHGLDLSRWVTQPCIIVIGEIGGDGKEGTPTPVPLTVDGEPIRSTGRTVVRWVMPLESRPPGYGGAAAARGPGPLENSSEKSGEKPGDKPENEGGDAPVEKPQE